MVAPSHFRPGEVRHLEAAAAAIYPAERGFSCPPTRTGETQMWNFMHGQHFAHWMMLHMIAKSLTWDRDEARWEAIGWASR